MAKRSGIGDFVLALESAASAHLGLQARALLSHPEGSANASGWAYGALGGRVDCCTPHRTAARRMGCCVRGQFERAAAPVEVLGLLENAEIAAAAHPARRVSERQDRATHHASKRAG